METKMSCCGDIFGYAKVSTIVELSLSVIANTGLLVGFIYDVFICNFGLFAQLGIYNLICISTNTILVILELKNICRKSIKKWNLVMRIIWTVAVGLIVILYLIQLISCTNHSRDYFGNYHHRRDYYGNYHQSRDYYGNYHQSRDYYGNYHRSRDYYGNYHRSRDYYGNYHHSRDYYGNYHHSRDYYGNYHHSRDACLIWDRETYDHSDLSLIFSICLLIVGPMFLYGIFKSFLLFKLLKSQSDLPQQLGLPLTRLSQFYGPNSTLTLT